MQKGHWDTDRVRPILEAYCAARGIEVPEAWWWSSGGESVTITTKAGLRIEANKHGVIMTEEQSDD